MEGECCDKACQEVKTGAEEVKDQREREESYERNAIAIRKKSKL